MNGSMPQIPLGQHTLSRLILGANPINGGSHLSRFVDAQMKRYFSPEGVLKLLTRCQELGINTWQSNPANLDLYRAHRQQGGQMHYICLAQEDESDPQMLERAVSAGTIAVAHHGEFTDRYWKGGEIHQVRDYCKKIRDAGVLVGVSTHIPEVVKHVIEEDWDVDFFMCCVYERHRTREELLALLGHVPIPIPEVYLESDPPRMFAVMRQTEKPCLAFKILAAGRLCEDQATVEKAFRETFAQIKPNDGVIVGMYPEYEDQPALNVEYVKKYGGNGVACE